MYPHRGERRAEHVVAFYEAERFIVERLASFVTEGLAANEQVIVLAATARWAAVSQRVEARGLSYGRAISEGRLVIIDAQEMVDTLTVDGRVSVDGFRAMFKPLIRPGVRMRVYGELVSLVAQRGDVETALAIERLGHELAHTLNAEVLCGYHVAGARPLTPGDLARIQDAHDRTVCEDDVPPARGLAPEAASTHFHAVRFYESRESLSRIVGKFLGSGFAAGLPAVVIATPEHREAITRDLTARFFDPARLESSGDLIMIDAETLLSQFMSGSMPDPARFRAALIPVMEAASRGRGDRVVQAYGEMVDVLWKRGQTVAAVRLEMLWNELAHSQSFALLCGYAMGQFYKGAAQQEIAGLHTHVVSNTGAPPGVH